MNPPIEYANILQNMIRKQCGQFSGRRNFRRIQSEPAHILHARKTYVGVRDCTEFSINAIYYSNRNEPDADERGKTAAAIK